MAGPLFYRPSHRWRTAVAFAGAVLIHFGAIVLANVQQHEAVSGPGLMEDKFPPIDLEPQPPDEESEPPDAADPAPTPEPTDEALIPEERPTPAPVRHQNTSPATPIQKARISQRPGHPTPFSAKVLALNAPRPEYPYEARRQKITGHGIVVMTIDSESGNVIDVTMLQSTGSPVLDNATLSSFRRWRFKTGAPSKVRVPITFTMTGAQY
jgi:TonB family protein